MKKAEVFISHSFEDHAEALQLRDALASHGVECWTAPENIEYGQDWPERLESALETCRVFILLNSPSIRGSKYIPLEVRAAHEAGAKLFHVRLAEGVGLARKLAFFLGSSQWIDAYAVPAEEWRERLVASVLQELRGGEDDDDEEELDEGGSNVYTYRTYAEALKSTGTWGYVVPAFWWIVCGLIPSGAIVLEYRDEGIFLAKLWPHFFLFPLLIGFLIPVCLTAPLVYMLRNRRLKLPWITFLIVSAAYITFSDVRAGDPALWEYDRILTLDLMEVEDPNSAVRTAEVVLPGTAPRHGGKVVRRSRVMEEAHALIETCPELKLGSEPAEGGPRAPCDERRQRFLDAMREWRDGATKRWSATHWAYVVSLFLHVLTLGLSITCLVLLLRLQLQLAVQEPALHGLMALIFFTYFLWLPFRIVSLHEKANLFLEVKILTEAPITIIVVLCYAATVYLTLRSRRSLPVYMLLTVTGSALVYTAAVFPELLFYVIGRSSDPLTYPMITIALLVIVWPLLGGGRAVNELGRPNRSPDRPA